MNTFVVAVLALLGVANAGLIAPGVITTGIAAPIATPADTVIAGPSGSVVADRATGRAILTQNLGPINGIAPIATPLAAPIATPLAAPLTTGIIANNGLLARSIVAPGLIGNGLIANGLIGNGLIGNGLIGNGLIANGLVGNGLIL